MPAHFQIRPASGTPFQVAVSSYATIGRQPGCSVQLLGCTRVSRLHAQLVSAGSTYQIIDLGSNNGTYIDEERLILPRLIDENHHIRIGSYHLQLVIAEDGVQEQLERTEDETLQHTQTSGTAAVLVCDVSGFSTHSELLVSSALAQAIGGWFRTAHEIVTACGGIISQFVGDAFLAFWPEAAASQPATTSCYQAAVRLKETAADMRWPEPSNAPWITRYALHYGSVLFDNIGAFAPRDCTIIGDTVTTAFRMEQWMKSHPVSLVWSAQFQEALHQHEKAPSRSLGAASFRGKNQPTDLFTPQS